MDSRIKIYFLLFPSSRLKEVSILVLMDSRIKINIPYPLAEIDWSVSILVLMDSRIKMTIEVSGAWSDRKFQSLF